MSNGVMRGRAVRRGVGILWRKSVFSNVTTISCNSDRLTAMKVQIIDRSFLLFSVYMPTDELGTREISRIFRVSW